MTAQETLDYIPSTLEKKRVITILLFMGIIMSLAKQQKLSVYERYYLALALSLWTVGLLLFFVTLIVLIVVPILGYLFVLILLARIGLLIYTLVQAWAAHYNSNFLVLRVLHGLGERLLSIFASDTEDEYIAIDDEPSTTSTPPDDDIL